jgi:ADP-heptose:LPS heptosyltransferase
MPTSPEEEPRRIGVVHLNQVGDLMFSLPALAALRAGFPQARIASIVKEPLEPLLAGNSLVDEVLLHRGSRDFFASLGRLRASDLDLLVCLSQSPRSRLLAYGSGAPRRVGLGGGHLESLLTESIASTGLPSTANNLRVTEVLGCPVAQPTYQGLLQAGDPDRAAARAVLREAGWTGSGNLVVFACGASRGREHKEWPGERQMESCRRTASEDTWAVIVGTGWRAGVEHAPSEGVIDLTGRTGLRELMGLLGMAELFVGIDSGVLHLAAALGVPCVALFGPTDPQETGPQGGGHRIVRADPSGPGAMEAIETDEVTAVVATALGRIG